MRDYFEQIGMSSTEVERAIYVVDLSCRAFSLNAQEIFVDDVITPEGNRKYTSIYIFEDDKMSEIKYFMNNYQFDFTRNFGIDVIEQKPLEYDFSQATSSSKLTVDGYWRGKLFLNMMATGKNCDNLFGIVQRRLLPRV